MLVYHGSDHIIKVPVYNGSKRTNDYGYGFYTTENIELAKEWACADNRDGFANCYEADSDGLSVLDLNAPEFNILNGLAILTRYRTYWQNGSIAEKAMDVSWRGRCLQKQTRRSSTRKMSSLWIDPLNIEPDGHWLIISGILCIRLWIFSQLSLSRALSECILFITKWIYASLQII